MASTSASSIAREVSELCALFDEAVSGVPVIGSLLAPAWRVVRIDPEGLASGEGSVVPAGRHPVVARLAPGLGLRVPVRLPLAARADLASAAQLALEAASPIAPGYGFSALDIAGARTEGETVVVTAAIADRDTTSSAAALAMQLAGRVDAVDVEQAEAPLTPPRVDLRTGRAAARAGLTPSRLLAAVCAVAVFVGAGGLAAAAWRGQAASDQVAHSGSPLIRAALELAAKRRANPPMLDTVEALSAALPNSAWLETLEISGPAVKISGRAADAARLPSALRDNRSLSGAAFSGPTRGLENGQQAFEITLTRSGGRVAP